MTEIDTGVISVEYMNERFNKYLKLLRQEGTAAELTEQALDELHKTFAVLTQDEQKYANLFLYDIQRGDIAVKKGKNLRDYITEYQYRAKNDQIHRFADTFGLDEDKLRNMMGMRLTKANINEYGRFYELKRTVDKVKAKEYFEKKEGISLIPPKVNIRIDKPLREFLLAGGIEI